MIRFAARGHVDYRRVRAAVRRAEIRGLTRAAAVLRLHAARSLRKAPRDQPSPPGTPPHTRKGLLPKSILYALLEERGSPVAIVGPSFNLAGLSGKKHEFGGRFGGDEFPERPFMKPALDVIANRLPSFFSGSIKNT